MEKRFNVSMTVTVSDDSEQHEDDLAPLTKSLIDSWLSSPDQNPYDNAGDYSAFEVYCKDHGIYKGDIEMTGLIIDFQEASNSSSQLITKSTCTAQINTNPSKITTIDQHSIVSNMNLNIF